MTDRATARHNLAEGPSALCQDWPPYPVFLAPARRLSLFPPQKTSRCPSSQHSTRQPDIILPVSRQCKNLSSVPTLRRDTPWQPKDTKKRARQQSHRALHSATCRFLSEPAPCIPKHSLGRLHKSLHLPKRLQQIIQGFFQCAICAPGCRLNTSGSIHIAQGSAKGA